jgi:hypothetical protein
MILTKSDFAIGVKAFNATLLLIITLEPDFTIRMGGRQGFEQGGQSQYKVTALTKEATGLKVELFGEEES